MEIDSKKYKFLIYREEKSTMTEATAIEEITDHPDTVSWTCVSAMHKLSEGFIEKYEDKVNWDMISLCQNLSEDFIRKYQERLNWIHIFRVQKLSEDFVEEFRNKVSESDWEFINRTKHIFENPYSEED